MSNAEKAATLYLLNTHFTDAEYAGETFFCPFCIQVEGLLASFPVIRHDLDIRYVDFQKPRGELAKLCGEENQSCPQIIFPQGDDAHSGEYSIDGLEGTRCINDTKAILDYLARRIGLPRQHP
jgi:hypothetical protein